MAVWYMRADRWSLQFFNMSDEGKGDLVDHEAWADEGSKYDGPCMGIDLGTTNSCVALWNSDGSCSKVYRNEHDDKTTPSIVAFHEDGTEEVGKAALELLAAKDPKNLVRCIKRLMGKTYTEATADSSLPTDMVLVSVDKGGAEKDALAIQIGERLWSPEDISAMILRKMKKTCEDKCGQTIENAVITAPAYFNHAQVGVGTFPLALGLRLLRLPRLLRLLSLLGWLRLLGWLPLLGWLGWLR
jgi:molecular chaperone DnaK (HSP70)